MKSRYLEGFSALETDRPARRQTVGSVIWVEEVKRQAEQKSAGGIYIPDTSATQRGGIVGERPTIAIVVRVGEGYFDDTTDGIDVPLDVRAGDVILIGENSTRWFNSFGNIMVTGEQPRIGLAKAEDILHRWFSIDDYLADIALLSTKVV